MTTEPNDGANGAGGAETGHSAWDLGGLPLDQQVALLTEELQRAQEEAARSLDVSKRAQAEMANFKKRTDDERIASAKYANSRLIGKFLPAIEELDLAIGHAAQVGSEDPWIEGVKLIQRKLNGVLESEGVTLIEVEGVMFNPLEHEAVGIEESTAQPPGYVTRMLRPGYRLHDRVIRAAQVMVAREPQQPTQSNSMESEEETNG